ncbi:MAG: hypothetical protein GY765_40100 [bacterium]|nr:hypothetical protein [bacterium]
MKQANYDTLVEKARQIRLDTLHLAVEHNNGHIASALSCVEILTVLYEHVMEETDKFIMAKGHGVLSFYVVLRDKGFNPVIAGHPDMDPEQGIHCTTGSLGHGAPMGAGMALARKLKHEKGRIFVLMGDGECQEGSVWETLNLIRKYKLNNIILIVDYNKLQALDSVETIGDEADLKNKFEAFGVKCLEADGHDFGSLLECFSEAKKSEIPCVVLAHTVKGKGISFMENVPCWHSRMPDEGQLKVAFGELQ